MSFPDTGQVIIRLDKSIVSDALELPRLAAEQGLTDLEQFLAANPGIGSERVVDHVEPGIIRERERLSGRSDYSPIKSLAAYWRLDLSAEDDAEAMRQDLHKMSGIEIAHHETGVIEAGPVGPSVSSNLYEANQGILNAAPVGIDARSAWCKTNGMGEHVNVVDCEMGWITGHQDLPKFAVLHGDNGFENSYVDGNHGASALGIVGGLNNTLGIIGIAPNLASLNVVSHYYAKSNSNLHVANAIDAATKYLGAGDILYIEVQRPQGGKVYPVEINSADFHAIRHATSQGIIVVEAAGNWQSNNLEDWVDPTGEHSLNPDSPLFSDSGAIMVGCCYFPVVTDPLGYEGHARYYRSNYGRRVNCYAWGERNYSTGGGTISGSPGSTDSYTNSFGETSAATAIVAGAAALTQSWYKSCCGAPLDGPRMRTVLSNPNTATKQANINGQPIGVMPDLNAILTWRTRFVQIITCVFGKVRRGSPLNVGEFDSFKASL